MDEVVEEVERAKKEWEEAYNKTQQHIKSIQNFRKSRKESSSISVSNNKDSLLRLNALAQDELGLLNSLQFKFDFLAPQLPSHNQIESALSLLRTWKKQIQSLRLNLRNANLQAKENMRKAALEERELLLGGGEESTIRRRNLQTKAGMTNAAETITDSLRRTRQMMVQEVERSGSTLMAFEESTGVLRKAETEYKRHRSLLMRTRNLLSTMQRQDVLDMVILIVGFLFFSLAVLYVVSKRIGILRLQRTVTAAIRSVMARPGGNGLQLPRVHDNVIPDPRVEVALRQPMHDEL